MPEGSSGGGCHMCHIHDHVPGSSLLRTHPLRVSHNRSRNPSKSSHTRHSRDHSRDHIHHSRDHIHHSRDHSHHSHHSHHSRDSGSREIRDAEIKQAKVASALAKLSERSHSLPGSRSSTLSRPNEVSILPDVDAHLHHRHDRRGSTGSRADYNGVLAALLETRAASLPSHHSGSVHREPDLLTALPRTHHNSRTSSLSRTRDPHGSNLTLAQDTEQDYYMHIHRARYKDEARKQRFNLQTVMLIGCYTLLFVVAIIVGVVLCQQNGWLGFGHSQAEESTGAANTPTRNLNNLSTGRELNRSSRGRGSGNRANRPGPTIDYDYTDEGGPSNINTAGVFPVGAGVSLPGLPQGATDPLRTVNFVPLDQSNPGNNGTPRRPSVVQSGPTGQGHRAPSGGVADVPTTRVGAGGSPGPDDNVNPFSNSVFGEDIQNSGGSGKSLDTSRGEPTTGGDLSQDTNPFIPLPSSNVPNNFNNGGGNIPTADSPSGDQHFLNKNNNNQGINNNSPQSNFPNTAVNNQRNINSASNGNFNNGRGNMNSEAVGPGGDTGNAGVAAAGSPSRESLANGFGRNPNPASGTVNGMGFNSHTGNGNVNSGETVNKNIRNLGNGNQRMTQVSINRQTVDLNTAGPQQMVPVDALNTNIQNLENGAGIRPTDPGTPTHVPAISGGESLGFGAGNRAGVANGNVNTGTSDINNSPSRHLNSGAGSDGIIPGGNSGIGNGGNVPRGNLHFGIRNGDNNIPGGNLNSGTINGGNIPGENLGSGIGTGGNIPAENFISKTVSRVNMPDATFNAGTGSRVNMPDATFNAGTGSRVNMPDATFNAGTGSRVNMPDATFNAGTGSRVNMPDATFNAGTGSRVNMPDATFNAGTGSRVNMPDATFNAGTGSRVNMPDATFNAGTGSRVNMPDATFNAGTGSRVNMPDATFNPGSGSRVNMPDATFNAGSGSRVNMPDATFNPGSGSRVNMPDATFNAGTGSRVNMPDATFIAGSGSRVNMPDATFNAGSGSRVNMPDATFNPGSGSRVNMPDATFNAGTDNRGNSPEESLNGAAASRQALDNAGMGTNNAAAGVFSSVGGSSATDGSTGSVSNFDQGNVNVDNLGGVGMQTPNWNNRPKTLAELPAPRSPSAGVRSLGDGNQHVAQSGINRQKVVLDTAGGQEMRPADAMRTNIQNLGNGNQPSTQAGKNVALGTTGGQGIRLADTLRTNIQNSRNGNQRNTQAGNNGQNGAFGTIGNQEIRPADATRTNIQNSRNGNQRHTQAGNNGKNGAFGTIGDQGIRPADTMRTNIQNLGNGNQPSTQAGKDGQNVARGTTGGQGIRPADATRTNIQNLRNGNQRNIQAGNDGQNGALNSAGGHKTRPLGSMRGNIRNLGSGIRNRDGQQPTLDAQQSTLDTLSMASDGVNMKSQITGGRRRGETASPGRVGVDASTQGTVSHNWEENTEGNKPSGAGVGIPLPSTNFGRNSSPAQNTGAVDVQLLGNTGTVMPRPTVGRTGAAPGGSQGGSQSTVTPKSILSSTERGITVIPPSGDQVTPLQVMRGFSVQRGEVVALRTISADNKDITILRPDPNVVFHITPDAPDAGVSLIRHPNQKPPASLTPGHRSLTSSRRNGDTLRETTFRRPRGRNSKVLRRWEHMDDEGTLSRGLVRSDGSFAFSNCRPPEVCGLEDG
ncbi:uncharacterized protein DDB_G0283357 [Procambarus clarkii]|uniref:uncharacterized protein DDB_G0283357 n=1 Tax=Procambarus clarkii TaxID=6728 RepID=UPI001E676933|nr:probable serine/threonine-protein kinase DDB_G0282963 [Procambarus clarkii]XP_045603581.1 probable serine/threonine-protein kinase DDB_G0282963 [Procambarus clarkii]XP_045603582.1 probable serine/threonine-protein kinase DDB_G0282963 [Procambarus clarkii]